MGLLDGLEKLINEHGSAAILKERIALANDKYAALESKLSDAELKVKQLESEKQSLELDSYKLKEKLRDLEQLEESQGSRLEEIREKILTTLSARHESTAPHIASLLGIGE